MFPDVLPDSFAPTHGSWVAWWVPALLGATCVLVAFTRPGFLARRSAGARALLRGGAKLGLAVAVVASLANYVDFGRFRYGTYLNEWATFHYYLGSKYAPELHYHELYAAALVADEASRPLGAHDATRQLRDLRTGVMVPADVVLDASERHRSRFSPTRWREFVADVAWFRAQLPPARWSLVFSDHGYNATPFWSVIVRNLLTNPFSIESPAGRWVLMAVDPLLLLAAVAAVAWAYGPRVAAFVVVLVGTHYLMSWGHMKGMIARTDFAVCTVIATCCLEKQRFKTAGALMAWAVASRVFPVVFLVGPAMKLLDGLVRHRAVPGEWARFFAAFAATLGALFVLTLLAADGIALWDGWVRKILLHYQSRTDWSIGYQVLVDVTFHRGVPVILDATTNYAADELLMRTVALSAVRLAVCVPAAFFTRSMRASDALSFGFVFLFMFVSCAYYYYIILMVPFLFFARRSDRPAGAIGVALMWITGSLGYLLFSGWDRLSATVPIFRGFHQDYATYYWMTALLGVGVLAMLVVAAVEEHRHDTRVRALGAAGSSLTVDGRRSRVGRWTGPQFP